MSYCSFVQTLPAEHVHRQYHDSEYGFPMRGDAELFERLALEINQAGLSWLTVLQKRPAFTRAFAQFDVDTVAAFDEADVERLMADAGIIRNRRKVLAVIENARRLQALRSEYGSFADWLDAHHPRPKAEWLRLFKKTFVFVGGEIVGEFLMSTGYLDGAHEDTCPVYPLVLAQRPAWLSEASD